ncbi:MAG: hypothetical protein GYA35_05860 [Thermoanaerobaculaceae bacterium]|nr:hypothetical protein [Thermoanaerobaculaceae bacterium]
MKKVTKLLIGCLLLLIIFCLLSACLTFVFWKRIYDFIEPYLSSAGVNISNVSVVVFEKIFKIAGIL